MHRKPHVVCLPFWLQEIKEGLAAAGDRHSIVHYGRSGLNRGNKTVWPQRYMTLVRRNPKGEMQFQGITQP